MKAKFDRGLDLNEILGTAATVCPNCKVRMQSNLSHMAGRGSEPRRWLCKTKPFPKLPKRCKFFVACHGAPTRWAWHTFLKKDVPVCEHCFATNDYLVHEPPQG